MKDTFQFDFKEGDFVLSGKDVKQLSGIAALRMWIAKILRTQLNRYDIYSTYGANIEDLVVGGTYNFDFTVSELKREIENALYQNEDITDISDFVVTRTAKDELTISFTVTSVYGETAEEVTL